jgi:thiol reductant ABC exporter CydC subunit
VSAVPGLLRLARPQAGRLLLAVLLGVAAAGCAIGLTATSAWLISRAAERPPVLSLTLAIVAVRAFGIGRGVLRYAERLAGHDAALRVLAELRVRVYSGLERLAPSGLIWVRGGDALTRLVGDVDAVADLFVRVLVPGLAATLACLAGVGLLAALLPAAGAAALAGLCVAGVLAPALTEWVSRRAEQRSAQARARLASGVVDLVDGAAELAAFDAAGLSLAGVAAADAELARAQRRSAVAAGLGAALCTLACGLTVVAALLVGIPPVRSEQLSGPLLAVLVLTPLALFEVAAALPQAAAGLSRARNAASRVLALVDAEPVVPEPSGSPAPAPAWGAGSALCLRGVSARWNRAGPLVLDRTDLDIRDGERIAVIGPSGGGKTTLAAVLVRLLDPAAGMVSLNGVDYRRLRAEDIRRLVGLSGQDAHLFDTTIRENLLIGHPAATEQDLRSVLRRVRLDEWSRSLPGGLDTRVGPAGAAVSGGQRQRLALARALLADPAVLILDEPTAHLDDETAAALTADLLAATRDRTMVWLTHRLEGLAEISRVLVLDRGRLSPIAGLTC